ncbi:DNA methyltransferase, partial [Escherichia coli]|uniref:DNA methyltransferase n=1 Tax=Escherichia coli TaxID=562 RepID=UPI003D36874C
LKPKDLHGIPWRLAFALQDDGWYLRSDIIWNKPNAMPESVKDRPTRSHEYLFMLTKSEKYYYDHVAVKEPNGRNMRSVWNVHTKGFP